MNAIEYGRALKRRKERRHNLIGFGLWILFVVLLSACMVSSAVATVTVISVAILGGLAFIASVSWLTWNWVTEWRNDRRVIREYEHQVDKT